MGITSVSEAEKANRALFGNLAAPFTKEMGWIPPIQIPIESKSNDNALSTDSTRSGPRRKFNLSSINSLIAPNEEQQQNVPSQTQSQRQSLSSRSSSSSFSRRTRNPLNPDSDDRFAGNWGVDLEKQRHHRFRRECGMQSNRVIGS